MIEFDLEKYAPKRVERIHGKKKYLCKVRKSFVQVTPEEKVRQAFLNFLIDEKKFPLHSIKVEESIAHYQKGSLKRIDILVLDHDNAPFIIYECKNINEAITDDVINQGIGYFDQIDTAEYLGFVNGLEVRLAHIPLDDSIEVAILLEHPNYETLSLGGDIEVGTWIKADYKRNSWKLPRMSAAVNELVDQGIIGEKTDERFHSFIVNIDGWLMDEEDVLEGQDELEDFGLKHTKFGNAGGGFFTSYYRSFLLTDMPNKPIVCITLTSMGTVKSGFGTSLYVGIESDDEKHSCLQLRIGNSITIKEGFAEVWHSGAITVGRLGAAKRKDMIEFVAGRAPQLVRDGKVYLGKFYLSEDIKSNQSQTKKFLSNLTKYAGQKHLNH